MSTIKYALPYPSGKLASTHIKHQACFSEGGLTLTCRRSTSLSSRAYRIRPYTMLTLLLPMPHHRGRMQ
jgi:hypothetical protein